MERTPSFLAAIAGAAVPELDPATVEALPSTPDQSFDVAFVEDAQHRRWVVRAPRTAAAAARMDLSVALLGLLSRRLPFAVPSPKGFVELKEGGRAVVYPYLPGRQLDFAELPPGPGIAAELGRAIAALHNTDVALYDEAGMPSYDADDYRTRRLAELDRAAESGKVPAGLLARWERALEDVTLWRFAPTPVHGDLTGDQVLAVFEDESDSSTGRIRAMTGWEDAKVADPADDFAALVAEAHPDTVDTVLEAYAHARVERPDRHLLIRARLGSELALLARLMTALAEERGDTVGVLTTELKRLDATVHDEQAEADDYRRTSLDPPVLRPRQMPPPILEDEEDEDLPAMAAADPTPEPDAGPTPRRRPNRSPKPSPSHSPKPKPNPNPSHSPKPNPNPSHSPKPNQNPNPSPRQNADPNRKPSPNRRRHRTPKPNQRPGPTDPTRRSRPGSSEPLSTVGTCRTLTGWRRRSTRPRAASAGLLALARAWHARCLADPVAAHPFEHPGQHPDHLARLAAYWGEALGGPAAYSDGLADHSHVLRLHACNGAHPQLDAAAIACFEAALGDVGITDEPLRSTLAGYVEWGTDLMAAHPDSADGIPDGLAVPRWSWDGPVTGSAAAPR